MNNSLRTFSSRVGLEGRPRRNRAFTLIELVIVVAIIGIITATVMVNFSSSKAKARDAKRVSDLGNIQLALNLYFDRCRLYPVAPMSSAALSSSCSTSSGTIYLRDFISSLPTDPSTASSYAYWTNDAQTDFILRATLEAENNSIQRDSLSNTESVTIATNRSYTGLNLPGACYVANDPSTKKLYYCLGAR